VLSQSVDIVEAAIQVSWQQHPQNNPSDNIFDYKELPYNLTIPILDHLSNELHNFIRFDADYSQNIIGKFI
jgi:hypothetical protein